VAVEAILKAHSHLANKLYRKRTLLAEPCRRGKNQMVRLLLSCGVSVNNCNSDGCPAIWYAVRYNNLEVVQILFENGADLEINCLFHGFRCLDYAIVLGFYDVAQYLYRSTSNKLLKSVMEY
jgi:ankyrin repeat protein